MTSCPLTLHSVQTDLSNYRSNPNFIQWIMKINGLTEEQAKELTAANYLKGYCEDWAVYFSVRYNIDMLFLNKEHNIICFRNLRDASDNGDTQIKPLYFDAANCKGVSRLSDLIYVITSIPLSRMTEEELEKRLVVVADEDWKTYSVLADNVDMIERVQL